MARREILRTAALLAAVLAATFWSVVFLGESLVVSDSLNPLDPSRSAHGYGPASDDPARWDDRNLVYTPNLNDPWAAIGDWEPNEEFLRNALAAGSWPLWNPYVGAGVPDLPDTNAAYFFPPHLVVIALGNSAAVKTAYILLLVFQAGLFFYLWLRSQELSKAAGFLGALVYMLGGGVTQHLGLQLLESVCCLPVVLYATHRFLTSPTRTRTAVLTAVYAVVSLTGFVPMLVAIFGLASSYAGWMILAGQGSPRHTRRSLLFRYAAACALAVGVVAFSYVPAIYLNADPPAQVEAFYSNIDFVRLPAGGLYSLLSPTLIHGKKVWRDPPMQGLPEWNDLVPNPAWLMMPTVGVAPLLLAFLASPKRRAITWWLALFAAAAVSLLTVQLMKLDPFDTTTRIPGLAYIHYTPYFGFLYNALFAILAAVGLESLIEARVSRRRSTGALVVGLALLLALRWIATGLAALDHPHADLWLRDWWQAVILTFLVGGAALATAAQPAARLRRPVAAGLAALALLELAGNAIHPRNRRADVWRNPPAYIGALSDQAGLERVFADQGLMHANSSAAFGIFGLDSLNAYNTERVFELYREHTGSTQRLLLMHPKVLPPEGVLERAAIANVLVRPFNQEMLAEAERRGYHEWYRDSTARIFRRSGSGRYFFSSHYRVLDAAASLEQIAEQPANREVLLEQEPPFPSTANLAEDPSVEVAEFSVNGYTLSLVAPRPGLVYLSESHFPGWSARVNGEEVEIFRANYAFRAVPVPPGPIVLELAYWPPGLTAGLVTSGLSLALLLGLCLYRPGAGREPI